ncbi:MAG TPA: AraC family transcriptional regulator [Phenylobacterium sp.]|jgi:AraC-like DNA-binding protein
MDALSDVLRVVGLTGGVFIEAEFTAPWWVAGQVAPELCRPFMAQPAHVVGFHYVVEGVLEIRTGGGPTRRVAAGEAVMMPRNDLHEFGDAVGPVAIGMDALIQPAETLGMSRVVHGGGGARTRLVCGFMGGNEQLHPLLAGLPPLMVVNVAGLPGGEWIGATFSYAAHSLGDGQPGAASVLAKLSEVLFVETLRLHLASLPADEVGWLAGLRDPAIGRALSLLHARVTAPWTAEALAREVNMSRSAFAERFTALVGQPPMRYLTLWRMQLARHGLSGTRKTVAQIAFDVGYESEAAFSRAFRRELGSPPASWRKQAAAP